MNFKLLCSDLDGTLLSTKNDVSAFTIEEINRIKAQMRIVLVSARMPKSMTYLQQRMGIEGHPIISYNGALVVQQNKVLSSTIIDINTAKSVHNICRNLGIGLGLYHNDEWCVESTSERVEKEIFNTRAEPEFESTLTTLERWAQHGIGPHKIMLMGTPDSINGITPMLEKGFLDELNCYRANDTLIEIAPRSVSKLQAIQSLLLPNETLKDVIAFGDNYNDIEMLEKVGYGVAMGNARDEAKAIANYIGLSNKEDGVARFVKEHL
nr:Cof-type HAD-IIB family hydrolase [Allomuricauda sp.]